MDMRFITRLTAYREAKMMSHYQIDNGKLIVELKDRGLLDVTVKETGRTLRNLNLLENRSDVAERWNWRPVPYDTTIYGDNSLEQFGVLYDGPYCTVWKLTYALRLQVKGETRLKRRSKEEQIQRVTTTVTVPIALNRIRWYIPLRESDRLAEMIRQWPSTVGAL